MSYNDIRHGKMGAICSVDGCYNYKNQREKKSFFSMPKIEHILKQWIVACNRKDLEDLMKTKPLEQFSKSYAVCSDHFETSCFKNKNLYSQGLRPGSVPTLNLPHQKNTIKRETRSTISLEAYLRERTTKIPLIIPDAKTSHEVESTSNLKSNHELPKEILVTIENLQQKNERLKDVLNICRKQLKNKASLISKYKKKNRILKEKLKHLQSGKQGPLKFYVITDS